MTLPIWWRLSWHLIAICVGGCRLHLTQPHRTQLLDDSATLQTNHPLAHAFLSLKSCEEPAKIKAVLSNQSLCCQPPALHAVHSSILPPCSICISAQKRYIFFLCSFAHLVHYFNTRNNLRLYLTFWAPALAIIGSLVIDTKEDTEVHYPWTFIRGLGIFWRHCSGFRALKVLSQH